MAVIGGRRSRAERCGRAHRYSAVPPVDVDSFDAGLESFFEPEPEPELEPESDFEESDFDEELSEDEPSDDKPSDDALAAPDFFLP